MVVGSEPARLIDTGSGRTLWTSTDRAVCASDGHQLVVCSSVGHLISWSTPDPVVRVSERPVEDSPRLVEGGRVHLDNGSSPRVVDPSGSPRLASLRSAVLAGSGGFLVFQATGSDGDSAISIRAVSPGR